MTPLIPPWLLGIAYLIVVLLGLYVSHKTRTLIFAVLAAGALPVVVFYGITAAGQWPSMEFAVAYSRMALFLLAINIIAMLIYVYRLVNRD